MLYSIIVLCSMFAISTPQDIDYDSPTSISLSVSWEDGKWLNVERSRNLNSLNPGSIGMPFSVLSVGSNAAELLDSCKSDGVLRVKTQIHTAFNKQHDFLSFMKTCSALQGPVMLTLSMDYSESIIAASASPSRIIENSEEFTPLSEGLSFNYIFKFSEAGPTPDTATYVNRLDKEREAKERGATQDNRSFFGKYWMYIVPIALFVLLSGSANSEGSSPAR